MSDLVNESVRMHSLSNTESNKFAVSKIRSLSAKGKTVDGVSGDQAALLGDAFAEVFASMAIASPPPVATAGQTTQDTNPSNTSVDTSEPVDDDYQRDSSSNEPDEASEKADGVVTGEFAVEAVIQSENIDSEPIAATDQPSAEFQQATKNTDTDTDTVDRANEVEAEEVAIAAVIEATTTTSTVDENTSRETTKENQAVAGSAGEVKPTVIRTKERREDPTLVDASTTDSEGVDATIGDQNPDESGDRESQKDRRRYSRDDKNASQGNAKSNAETNGFSDTSASQSAGNLPPGLENIEALPRISQPSASSANNAIASQAASAALGAGTSRPSLPVTQSTATSSVSQSNTTNQNGRPVNGLADVGAGSAASRDKPAKTSESAKSSTDTLTRIKLVQRVSRAFQHLGPEGGVVRLRLAPAELGTVRVEMRIQQKKVEARVVAETEVASGALREHLPELRARLEAHGMQVESLEIETEIGDDSSSSFDHRPDQDEQRQSLPRQRRSASPPNRQTRELTAAPVSRPSVSLASPGGVDVRF